MLKQMKILSDTGGDGYAEQERKTFLPIIYGQVISTVKILVTGATFLE